MSTEPRPFSLPDEFDEFCNSQLPPLLDPLPSIPTRRPSPIEPNARIHERTHNTTAKLTSRRKALAGAKSIGENEVSTLRDSVSHGTGGVVNGVGPNKRHKLDDSMRVPDFVQLPEPTRKPKDVKPLPFKSVPILNELHEPPPSAALFPPITPNAPKHDERFPKIDPRLFRETYTITRSDQASNGRESEVRSDEPERDSYGPIRRAVLRPRKKWTKEETDNLLEGVRLCGPSKWKKILNHPALSFSGERTTVDLKDRYRTCLMNQKKEEIRAQQIQDCGSGSIAPRCMGSFLVEQADLEYGTLTSSSATSQPSPSTLQGGPSSVSSTDAQTINGVSGNLTFTSVNSSQYRLPPTRTRRTKADEPKHPQPYRPHRVLPPRWTSEEDSNLVKGHQKYGFQWTLISQDSEIDLGHRKGSQIRDRFRLKFPELYQNAAPPPKPKGVQKQQTAKPEPKVKREPKGKLKAKAKKNMDKERGKKRYRGQILESHLGTINRSQRESNFNTNPLPRSPEPYTVRPYEPDPSPELHDGQQDSLLEPQRKAIPGPYIPSRSPGTEAHSSDDESKQSFAPPDCARHPGIPGLLNYEDEEVSRRAPVRDSDDWTSGGLTLPPLQWEDLGPRPLFEVDP